MRWRGRKLLLAWWRGPRLMLLLLGVAYLALSWAASGREMALAASAGYLCLAALFFYKAAQTRKLDKRISVAIKELHEAGMATVTRALEEAAREEAKVKAGRAGRTG